jgi:hypothetical protein
VSTFRKLFRTASLLTGSALVMFATGNIAILAQSQTPTPAASATTIPGQKPEATPTPPTGTIKGRLVADDGQPLMNANVLAQSLTTTPFFKPTAVDSEGRFSFDDLPAAAYFIIATAPGYIDQTMSLGDTTKWPRHLIGSSVRVTMIKGGVITGLVTNAKGEPVVGVPVHATMVNAPASITNYLTGAGVAETDDRGIYRLYGLLPGQYTVNAGGSAQFGRFTPSGFDRDVPTYYPSSTRDTAVPVAVRGGDETSGIDIKYKGAEGHSISGTVLGTIEASAQAGAITVFLANAGSASALGVGIVAINDPRRPFSFDGIADGEYEVFASYLANQTEGALAGSKRVTVRGGDVTGVELTLTPLASIAGSVTLKPIKPEDKCDKRLSQVIETMPVLARDEPKKNGSETLASLLGGGLGTLSAQGEFAMRNLEPGRYRFEVKLPTESWYVSAINMPAGAARVQPAPTAGPASVVNPNSWQGVMTIKPGEKLAGLAVVIGQDAAGFSGRFETQGAIQEGTRVHLIPVEREQANNVLRYSETFVKSDGSFAFTNIAPGRYFLLQRLDPVTETDAPARPLAWNPVIRAKLRLEAEKANRIVELKSCERVVDYTLKPGG